VLEVRDDGPTRGKWKPGVGLASLRERATDLGGSWLAGPDGSGGRVQAVLRRRLDNARERVWLWSPWVGQSSRDLLPHLRAAQDRAVLVHPVVLWPEEVQPGLRSLHQEIGAVLARTVYLKNMHQKIIIIDDLSRPARAVATNGSPSDPGHKPGTGRRIKNLKP
jgi:hypothetical protein